MGTVGFHTPFPKNSDTHFIVRNIAPNGKRIKLFTYPIRNGYTRDLLDIPAVSEADIRHSLLKGELMIKIRASEIEVVDSDINLLQFNDSQKAFLENAGITNGLEVTAVGGGDLTEEQHKVLLQLIHLADGDGPMEGFSGAYRETLPLGNPFPAQIIWYTDNTKATKIVEKNLIYDNNRNVTRIVQNVYDTGGTLLARVRDDITYQGPFETTRTRTVT